MKCYSLVLLILICGFKNSISLANTIVPYQNDVLKVGEIILVKVESEKNSIELKSLKHKKIGNVLYVMDFQEIEEERLFKVFVSPPPEKLKTNTDFTIRGFKFEQGKNKQIQDFLVAPTNFTLSDRIERFKHYGLMAVISFIFVLLGVFFYRKVQKKKMDKLRSQRLREMADGLVALFKDVKVREDFEEISRKRKEISKYLDYDKENLDSYLEYLDQIQYKKDWESSEFENIRKLLESIKFVRLKNGI